MSEQMEARSRVLCGIDGSDTDADTARQAAVLAGPEGQLEIVCVTRGAARAEQALESAQAIAAEVGTPASTRAVEDDDVWDGLASAAADHDLVVLGDRLHHGSASTSA